jgi:hypothetical protein
LAPSGPSTSAKSQQWKSSSYSHCHFAFRLSNAAKSGYWIGAAHISFRGLGHEGARDGGFVWIPGEYTARMSVTSVTGQAK